MIMAIAIGFGFLFDYEKRWQQGAGLASSAPRNSWFPLEISGSREYHQVAEFHLQGHT